MPGPTFPKEGAPAETVLAALEAARAKDADWRSGRTFSLVYYAGEEHLALLKEAYGKFFSENGLSPLAFPSLKKFEAEAVSMVADLFHGGPAAAGTLTSGGTESILMAVKAARERAKAERGVTAPEMVLPLSAHPAFEKAAHYLCVKPVHVPLDADFKADVAAARALVNDRTCLVVGSAVSYPQGVVDPIPELAAIASERGIGCHVDACLGGFQLAFLERCGEKIPPFDFRVPGVTSISADLHKYGFAAKGASSVIYRDRALRRHQFYVYTEWPGGVYASPSAAGTRPGGPIAAAWAVLRYMGEDGYKRLHAGILETTRALMRGIEAIPGLRILGKPVMGVFAFSSETIDVYRLAEAMTERGWHLDRLQFPSALHMMITPAHARVVDPFLADLRACAATLEGKGPAESGSAAMYGMMATCPDRDTIHSTVLEFMDGMDITD